MDQDSISSLDSERQSVVDGYKVNERGYETYEQSRSPSPAMHRTRTGVSLASSMTRGVRRIVDQVRDDNMQTASEDLQRPRTYEIADQLGLEEAITIATNKSEHTTTVEDDSQYPQKDTGYAWVVCAMMFVVFFSTWGTNGSYGVFLNYWLQNETFPNTGATDFALIGSCVLGLAQIFAPLSQTASAIVGLRPTMALGLILQTLGYLLASFATKKWELYLTQGVLVGFGFSFLFNPSIVILPEWFDKRRGLSFGIIASSSGVGGVIFSLSCQAMINKTGTPAWAQRALAIITFFLNLLATLFIKERIPAKRLSTWHDVKLRIRILFNKNVLAIPQLYTIALWYSFVVSCYVVALYSLSAYGSSIGLTSDQGSHVTAIFNGCQAIGRVFIGLVADYGGRVNLACILSLTMLILVLGMWVNATTTASVFAYSVLSGLTFGASSVLNQPILADTIPRELFPAAWSFQSVVLGCFTLFCEVVALELRDMSLSKPFIKAQIFCGCFAAAGVLCVFSIREWKIRKMLTNRLKITEEALEIEKSDQVLIDRKSSYLSLLRKDPVGPLVRLVYPVKV
ncbi:hypothetical protein OGAPHI_006701 [Ogataea philodendri]|uniref:Transporter ESBP6 n=1 Tax=Ogataea philodendri TaxID=1378263 RepID=A0A9P8T0L1_9ASCO|nr:uncharacterized protein OGAPHI_006701 [Ogataea philodendri]KAH3661294.1 hypothetical protein OGAPHI_006701 [Ogataea philodendri]